MFNQSLLNNDEDQFFDQEETSTQVVSSLGEESFQTSSISNVRIPSLSVMIIAELRRRNCNTNYSSALSCLTHAPKDAEEKAREILDYFINNRAFLNPLVDEDITIEEAMESMIIVYKQFDSYVDYLKDMKGAVALTPSKTMGVVALGAALDEVPNTAMYLSKDGIVMNGSPIHGTKMKEWFDLGATVAKASITVDGQEANKQMSVSALASAIMNTGVLARRYYNNSRTADISEEARRILEDGRFPSEDQKRAALCSYIMASTTELAIDYNYLDTLIQRVNFQSLTKGTKIGSRTYEPAQLLEFCNTPTLGGLAGMSAKGVRKGAFSNLATVLQSQSIDVYSLGKKDCGIPLVVLDTLDRVIEDNPHTLKFILMSIEDIPRSSGDTIGKSFQKMINKYAREKVVFVIGCDVSKVPMSQSGYSCLGWSLVDPGMEFGLFAYSGGLAKGTNKVEIGTIRWRTEVLKSCIRRGVSWIRFLSAVSSKADIEVLRDQFEDSRIASALELGPITSLIDFFRICNYDLSSDGAYEPYPGILVKVADLSVASSAENAVVNFDDEVEDFSLENLFEGTGVGVRVVDDDLPEEDW